MLRVFSFEDSKEFDKIAVERGFSLETLMEIAGKGVFEAIKKRFKIKNLRVVVVCGKGNNGGDGLVCARYLSLNGARVTVYVPPQKLSPLSEIQLKRLENLCEIKTYGEEIFQDISKADLAVDGIFGVGFSGKVPEDYRLAFEALGEAKFVVSIDVPSGLISDGSFGDLVVKADLTVCMGALKEAVILFPGRSIAGDLEVVDLGVPIPENLGNFLIEGEDIKGFLPSFVGNENKGDFGRLVVIAGSRKYPGALNLTLLGAIRGGVGLIYALNPYDIPIPYPEVIPIKEINFKPSALAIGPGFDDNENLFSLSYKILTDFPDVPAVLDADGLKLLKLYPQLLERENLIITPHPGEFSRLFGGTPYEVDRKRIELAREFSRKHKAILVLKGKPTVIGYRGKVYINPTGNLNLAKGGSGDILTGLIGAFLSWGIEPFKSSLMGVYIHGLAGELVQNRHFRITEIADKVPEAISKL